MKNRILSLLMVTLAIGLNAQSAFIEPLSKGIYLNDATRASLYNEHVSNIKNLTVTPIRMNNPWDFQEMDVLRLRLPGLNESLRAVVKRPRRYSETNYSWSGDILDEQNKMIGHAHFIRKGDCKFGSINLRGQHFIIQDMNIEGLEDDQLLIELDNVEIKSGCATHSEETENVPVLTGGGTTIQLGPTGGGEECEAEIDILVVYTQELIGQEELVMQKAELGVQALNTALSESDIPDVKVSAKIAAYELLSSFNENTNAAEAITSLMDNPDVALLRSEHHADLVLLFQTADLSFSVFSDNGWTTTDAAGIANINDVENLNEMPDVNQVFGILEIDASNEVLAHEVGHLLGCRHLKEDDFHEYANAYDRVCTQSVVVNGTTICNVEESTIMDGRTDASRVLRFSNPNGNYFGFPTGTEDHNNAQMIALTACSIGLFGESLESGQEDPSSNTEPFFNINVSGPLDIHYDEYISFLYSTYYEGCTNGTLSYLWEISWDYQNTFRELSTTEDAIVEGTDIPQDRPIGYLRLTSSCSEGPVVDPIIVELKNWSAINLHRQDGSPQSAGSGSLSKLTNGDDSFSSKIKSTQQINVYPNPVKDVLYLELIPDLTENPILIDLISLDGSKIQLFRGVPDIQSNKMSFEIDKIPSGYYLLEMKSERTNLYQPLIITH